MEYDLNNALLQLAKRCNADCHKAVDGAKPKDYTTLTLPVFTRYATQARNIGSSITALKYQIAVLNGVVSTK
ncbi:hypothetical protein [Pseudaeromonas pectinilytica]